MIAYIDCLKLSSAIFFYVLIIYFLCWPQRWVGLVWSRKWEISRPLQFLVAKKILITLAGRKTELKLIDSQVLNVSIYKLPAPNTGSKTKGAMW